MTELFVCFGMWLSMCGNIHVDEFRTDQQCRDALAEVRKSKGFDHGYCRIPKRDGLGKTGEHHGE
jgi:hypothetical protein